VDFGLAVAIQPNSEVFMGVRPEITMADPDIRNFKLVSKSLELNLNLSRKLKMQI
jgi:hypothetical protein